MHQQYLDRQYLAELLPIDQQYLVSGADMHSLLCDVVLPRPLMWRAFVRCVHRSAIVSLFADNEDHSEILYII